jgi:hypothetical protein
MEWLEHGKNKPPRAGLFIYSILRGWVWVQEIQLCILTKTCQAKGQLDYSTQVGEVQADFSIEDFRLQKGEWIGVAT